MLYNKLLEIEEFLNKNKVIIKDKYDDGRIVSLLSESKIVNMLYKNFSFIKKKEGNRDFGDIMIKDEKTEYPVNIKLTSKYNTGNDNLAGLVDLLRYLLFNNNCSRNHTSLSTKIVKGNFTEKENDYGFISVEKETGKVKVATMLYMEGYIVNPSNGFQANFNNIKMVKKTHKEAQKYLVKKYVEYQEKRSKPYAILVRGGF